MPFRIEVSALADSITDSTGHSIDLAAIREIRNSFRKFQKESEYVILRRGDTNSTSFLTTEEQRCWEEVERIAPTNEEFRASVVRFPTPQEWLEEDDQPF